MVFAWLKPDSANSASTEIDRICGEFAAALQADAQVRIESFLGHLAPERRQALFHELLRVELRIRAERSERIVAETYYRRFPDWQWIVDLVLGEHVPTEVLTSGTPSSGAMALGRIDLPPDYRLGNYSIIRKLGHGGFGDVYLARDIHLNREIALKVARGNSLNSPRELVRFQKEAQNAARIVHPGVAAIYGVFCDEYPPYIVQEYVEGESLKTLLLFRPPPAQRAVDLVAQLAETIAHAHQQGVYHRDLKPGNILITRDGRARIVDFGLSMTDDERWMHQGERCGTSYYMAPEQVRGESHRMDGRCDIWALGVILYQMLIGKLPFGGMTRDELFESILTSEVRPPRQVRPQLPAELERICLKTLAKRMSDRYSTALDLAGDLRALLLDWESAPLTGSQRTPADGASDRTPQRRRERAKIVPKGLRAYDENDADFFLELVPGPRDRRGIPEAVRFWTTRIEQTDSDATFTVGLVYGPSGCGKSSLGRAGRLPHLPGHVVTAYVVANQDEPPAVALLRQLKKRFPGLPDDLVEALKELRIGPTLPEGVKLLLVLDQFEQWLHGAGADDRDPLVHALRQCDGGRVQCLILVRDDFWLAISRFMRALEVSIIEGDNSALVDLFDRDHAKKVLTAFGRAYGRLDEDVVQLPTEQRMFVNEAVQALEQEGKVNCVRLALFAEMMKGKSWTPANLRREGGVEGVGAAFLEDRFASATAPPACRLHQEAARAVLRRLLPDSGAHIRGHVRSYTELMQASGYTNHAEF
ncbi:MAG: serine/threonine-protein kinase, partial [Pirellulaceae bacterium]